MIFILEQTSYACPEQYEVYLNKKHVGYLRLRNGYFYCAYPDIGKEIVYEAYPKGDGIFQDDEREFYLEQALQAIARKLGIDKFTYKIR